MKRLAMSLATLVLILVDAKGQVQADFVVNGGFEAVQIGSPFVSINPADIPNWTHAGSVGDGLLWGVGYADGGGSVTTDAGDGKQFVTLGGGFGTSGSASWEQTMTGLTPGETYTLSFAMASELASIRQSLTVDFPVGSSTAAQTFTALASSANYWRSWETKTENFVATSSSVELRFTVTNQEFDVGLDDVSVNSASVPAPEPSTVVLALTGILSTVGSRTLRRRMLASTPN